MKYLKYVPKTLLDDFVQNRIVPMVGAGFSKNASIPEGITIPDWNEMGRRVGEYIPDYQYTNAIDALSLFEAQYSRVKLIELISDMLHINEIRPADTHRSFCSLFFDTICTTNFDFLLEQTLQESQRPYAVVVSEERLSINTNEKTRLVKLHGDFNHPDKMVITEKDYDLFIENNKILATYIANMFITKTLFLVGYSFEDVDTRSIFQIVHERLGNLARPAYIVLVNANPIDISRFERRNIKVINLPGNRSEYPNILSQFFSEIKSFVDEKTAQNITVTREQAQVELKLPEEIKRLCYISAPYTRLSLLKEFLYPILEENGITPFASDEVIMPGDNLLSKTNMLIQEASMVIIDISGGRDEIKWELTSIRNMGKKMIIIAEEGQHTLGLQSLKYVPCVHYQLFGDNQNFAEQMEQLIVEYSNSNAFSPNDEPARLLQKKEYEAAVISAFRLLEMKIRDNTSLFAFPKFNTIPLLQKLRVLYEQTLDPAIREVISYMDIRNQIVHGSRANISKKKATDIVTAVLKVISLIETTVPLNI